MDGATITELKFDEHCRQSVHGLRGALLDLYRGVGADPSRPQEVSRRFKLNKNLTWKVSRIIGAEDAFAAVPLIPGPGGLDILLDAMAGAGASEDALARVRDAAEAFDEMVARHTGDRTSLELILDSMGVVGVGRPTEMSGRLAFRGNSGIWGIQAGTRVTAHFLAPSAGDPALLDLAMIGGLTRVRRLRPVERWPVFQIRQYNDDGSPAPWADRREAIEPAPGDAPGDPWLMRSFCAGVMPEIHVAQRGGATMYELGDGPVGRTGEFTCFFGFLDRGAVPRFRDGSNRFGELVSSVSAPVESLHFDLFVHESLEEARSPELLMYGTLGGAMDGVGSMRLPLGERVRDLGVAPMIDTPAIDRYGGAVAAVFERAGWQARHFRCLRLVVEHPPMSSRVIMRYGLPEAPSVRGAQPSGVIDGPRAL